MKHKLARSRYCTDCRRPRAVAGTCPECKEFNRVLNLLHRGDNALSQPGKELKIEFYAAIVERGGRLFE